MTEVSLFRKTLECLVLLASFCFNVQLFFTLSSLRNQASSFPPHISASLPFLTVAYDWITPDSITPFPLALHTSPTSILCNLSHHHGAVNRVGGLEERHSIAAQLLAQSEHSFKWICYIEDVLLGAP